jgi:hypothetical protein
LQQGPEEKLGVVGFSVGFSIGAKIEQELAFAKSESEFFSNFFPTPSQEGFSD